MMTRNGQITVPVEIRNLLKLKIGDYITIDFIKKEDSCKK
jgi:AbrB family looped-hinge helix DNA binding protein